MALLRAVLLLACGLAVTACASAPPTPEMIAQNDPYEPMNRQTLALNGKIDRYFVIPTVAVYFTVVPDRGRRVVHDFLGNITLPTTFVNDVLQGESKRAWETLTRLGINATVGVGGLWDPATVKFHLPNHSEDFGQTLAVWGAGEGPYLILPFLGPDPPRDAFGQVADFGLDPTNYIHWKQHIWWDAGRTYFTLLDLRGQTYEQVQGVQRASVDYYASLRSLYRQLRNQEIRNGRPEKDLPDF